MYYKDKEGTILHREDGPAIDFFNGEKRWYLNGKVHREGGPAIEWDDDSKFWYLNGKLHRENGPAKLYASGDKYYYFNGFIYYEITSDEQWFNFIKTIIFI